MFVLIERIEDIKENVFEWKSWKRLLKNENTMKLEKQKVILIAFTKNTFVKVKMMEKNDF